MTRRTLYPSLPLVLASLVASAAVSTHSQLDPGRDLSVTLSSRGDGGGPGAVFGVLTNRSANLYPCVSIEFDLFTRVDLREPGRAPAHLGVVAVEVRDVRPREPRNYQRELPAPAAVAFRSVSECGQQPDKKPPDAPRIVSFTAAPSRIAPGQTATLQWQTANTDRVRVGEANPDWPRNSADAIRQPREVAASASLRINPSATARYRLEVRKGAVTTVRDVAVEVGSVPAPAGTCSISGRVIGQLEWNVKDDRGQPVSFTLTHIAASRAGGTRERAALRERAYEFVVPAGHTYTVAPWSFGPFGGRFRSQPIERTIVCQPNGRHTGANFRITGPPPIG